MCKNYQEETVYDLDNVNAEMEVPHELVNRS